jgi:hypothetical protein
MKETKDKQSLILTMIPKNGEYAGQRSDMVEGKEEQRSLDECAAAARNAYTFRSPSIHIVSRGNARCIHVCGNAWSCWL